MHILNTKFHPDRSRNMERTGINSYPSYVKSGLFSHETQAGLTTLCKRLTYRKLANDQLDAQIFNTFITVLYMYMFRAISCSSSGDQIVLIQHLVSSLSAIDRQVHSTGRSLTDSDDTRCCINHLKTKRKLLHLKTQFVPRSKHFSSRL